MTDSLIAFGVIDADATRPAGKGALFGNPLYVSVSEKGVQRIEFNASEEVFSCGGKTIPVDQWPSVLRDIFRLSEQELQAYGTGTLRKFTVPLDTSGHPTWQSPRGEYWQALWEVPYGETVTYGELAVRAGRKKSAARAAGQACATNPWPILIPCHRVIATSASSSSDTRLGGFGGGLPLKKRLLKHEQTT